MYFQETNFQRSSKLNFEREREVFILVLTSSLKRLIGQFHVVVVMVVHRLTPKKCTKWGAWCKCRVAVLTYFIFWWSPPILASSLLGKIINKYQTNRTGWFIINKIHSPQETVTIVSDCSPANCWSIIGVMLVSCKIKPVLRSLISLFKSFFCKLIYSFFILEKVDDARLLWRQPVRSLLIAVHLLPSPWVCVQPWPFPRGSQRGRGGCKHINPPIYSSWL